MTRRLISPSIAENVYGVCLRGEAGEVDTAATDARRAQLRAARLAEGQPPASPVPPAEPAEPRGDALPLGDALQATPTSRGWRYGCRGCGFAYGDVRHPKEQALWREVPMETLSHWNRFGLVDGIAVRRKGDLPLLDFFLATEGLTSSEGQEQQPMQV